MTMNTWIAKLSTLCTALCLSAISFPGCEVEEEDLDPIELDDEELVERDSPAPAQPTEPTQPTQPPPTGSSICCIPGTGCCCYGVSCHTAETSVECNFGDGIGEECVQVPGEACECNTIIIDTPWN